MKITKEAFKKIVREVMTEESEYQTFFKKALEKTGKSIPDMSDEEKKAFFNKIDSAWQGKGEKKNEGNAFGAAVSDAKEKGEDEFKVGGEKFKVESVNETKFYAFFNNKKHEIEGQSLLDAKQKAILQLKVPKSKVGLLAVVNASEHDKGSFRYESVNEKVITEQLVPVDKKAVDAFFNKKDFEGKNLNSDGKVLKTVGVGSQEMYIHTPKGVKMVGKVTGQYAQSVVQYVNKNHKSDLVESVNEISISQLAVKDVEHLDTHVGGKSEKEVLKFIDNVYNFYPKNVRKFMADKFIDYQKGNINKKYLTGVFRIMHQQIR